MSKEKQIGKRPLRIPKIHPDPTISDFVKKGFDEEGFKQELRAVCEKYGVIDASFTGTQLLDGKMYASLSVDNEKPDAVVLYRCGLNIARLYQFARESALKTLDHFANHR